MTVIKVDLSSIDRVKKFANTLLNFDGDFDLVSDRYIVDGKSIMGIFSLDLSKPISLKISNDTQEVLSALEEFKVEE